MPLKTDLYAPPRGWNSFDAYGDALYEERALQEMNKLAEQYLPHGYEYFVIDISWYCERDTQVVDGLLCSKMDGISRHGGRQVCINDNGLVQPAPQLFPNGMAFLANHAHNLGLKFGLHMMRGMPKAAVDANCKIPGTRYTVKDIIEENDTCIWNPHMVGINTHHPAAQRYHDMLYQQFADWGVDFVKLDDVVAHPLEVNAALNAIEHCDREMIISLSPGEDAHPFHWNTYRKAHMLRTTGDIWDRQDDIDIAFDTWEKWAGLESDNFYPDLDMIPFGELCVLSRPEVFAGNAESLSLGLSYHHCGLNSAQKRTFITMRALAATPLMIGGSLLSMDAESAAMLTNHQLLACNANGVVGRKVTDVTSGYGTIELWHTPLKQDKQNVYPEQGWIGFFNRTDQSASVSIDQVQLGLLPSANYKPCFNYTLTDAWDGTVHTCSTKGHINCSLDAGDCTLLYYQTV